MRSGSGQASAGRRPRGEFPAGRRPRGGFAYVLLLVAVALIGLAASASVSLGARLARRDAELQLLAIGQEMQNALRSYAGVAATAAGTTAAAGMPPGARGPRELQDLLKDPRAPGLRRHLRQIYDDPMTGKAEWGVLRDAGGFITGVYSLADGEPIRRTGFEPALAGLEQAPSYREWVFGLPTLPRPAASNAGQAGATALPTTPARQETR